MLNSGPAVAGGAVYVDGHYGKVYALKRWVVSISASQCQFCASVPGYSAAAASVQLGGSGSPRLLRSLISGASIRFVGVRSYDRPDRSIVTVLLDTSM